MAFNLSKRIAQALWDEHGIKYGPKGSYEPYPRQWKCRAIIKDCFSGEISIRPIKLTLSISSGDRWVRVEEGGVTGYESARIENLMDKKSDWWACAGTPKRYDSMIIKSKDLLPVLREMREFYAIN